MIQNETPSSHLAAMQKYLKKMNKLFRKGRAKVVTGDIDRFVLAAGKPEGARRCAFSLKDAYIHCEGKLKVRYRGEEIEQSYAILDDVLIRSKSGTLRRSRNQIFLASHPVHPRTPGEGGFTLWSETARLTK